MKNIIKWAMNVAIFMFAIALIASCSKDEPQKTDPPVEIKALTSMMVESSVTISNIKKITFETYSDDVCGNSPWNGTQCLIVFQTPPASSLSLLATGAPSSITISDRGVRYEMGDFYAYDSSNRYVTSPYRVGSENKACGIMIYVDRDVTINGLVTNDTSGDGAWDWESETKYDNLVLKKGWNEVWNYDYEEEQQGGYSLLYTNKAPSNPYWDF